MPDKADKTDRHNSIDGLIERGAPAKDPSKIKVLQAPGHPHPWDGRRKGRGPDADRGPTPPHRVGEETGAGDIAKKNDLSASRGRAKLPKFGDFD
jgi:hypothetical protein